MKSQLFKNAWMLVKEFKMSFSDALKTSWKALKNEVKIVINTTWNNNLVLSFSKNNCTSDSIERVLEMVLNKKPVNQSGAKFYYDGVTFNND